VTDDRETDDRPHCVAIGEIACARAISRNNNNRHHQLQSQTYENVKTRETLTKSNIKTSTTTSNGKHNTITKTSQSRQI